MSWLRIDDGFAAHPKVTALSFRDRWTWMSLLCYAARYKTGGRLPENIREHVSGANDGFLTRCYGLGLLDHDDEGYAIHDWQAYSPSDPTGSERQAKWRKRKRDNTVTRTVTETVTRPSTSRARIPSRPVLSVSMQPERQHAGYVFPHFAAAKLHQALTDSDPHTERTIRRIAKRLRLTESDFAWALECATGPGVVSPSAVAIAELLERGHARAVA